MLLEDSEKLLRVRLATDDPEGLRSAVAGIVRRLGAFLPIEEALQTGDAVAVELCYRGGEVALSGHGVVLGQTPEGLHVAVEWTETSQTLLASLLTQPSKARPDSASWADALGLPVGIDLEVADSEIESNSETELSPYDAELVKPLTTDDLHSATVTEAAPENRSEDVLLLVEVVDSADLAGPDPEWVSENTAFEIEAPMEADGSPPMEVRLEDSSPSLGDFLPPPMLAEKVVTADLLEAAALDDDPFAEQVPVELWNEISAEPLTHQEPMDEAVEAVPLPIEAMSPVPDLVVFLEPEDFTPSSLEAARLPGSDSEARARDRGTSYTVRPGRDDIDSGPRRLARIALVRKASRSSTEERSEVHQMPLDSGAGRTKG